MSYTKIPNLYKDQTILMFKECWALEKIHGTSAHISWNDGKLIFFSGGEKQDNFIKLFDSEKLSKSFAKRGADKITIFGEAYGGKQQGMSETYGKELKFVAFDVKIDETWLCVTDAHELVTALFGLEFVHYQKTACDVSILDKVRDSRSVQAQRNGIEEYRKQEGIVLRPLIELKRNSGARICAKHKRDDFRERKTRQPIDSAQLKILEDASAIAEEWVTENRLNNLLSHISKEPEMSDIPDVVKRMIADVQIEAKDEIVESKAARKAIGKRTVALFKKKITTIQSSEIKLRIDNKEYIPIPACIDGYHSVRPKHTTIEVIPPGDE